MLIVCASHRARSERLQQRPRQRTREVEVHGLIEASLGVTHDARYVGLRALDKVDGWNLRKERQTPFVTV